MLVHYFSFVYAVLIFLGGLIGYFSAKSMISLISGCGSGLILLLSSFLLIKSVYFAKIILMLVTSGILIVFVRTLFTTLLGEKKGLIRSVVIIALSCFELYLLIAPQHDSAW